MVELIMKIKMNNIKSSLPGLLIYLICNTTSAQTHEIASINSQYYPYKFNVEFIMEYLSFFSTKVPCPPHCFGVEIDDTKSKEEIKYEQQNLTSPIETQKKVIESLKDSISITDPSNEELVANLSSLKTNAEVILDSLNTMSAELDRNLFIMEIPEEKLKKSIAVYTRYEKGIIYYLSFRKVGFKPYNVKVDELKYIPMDNRDSCYIKIVTQKENNQRDTIESTIFKGNIYEIYLNSKTSRFELLYIRRKSNK